MRASFSMTRSGDAVPSDMVGFARIEEADGAAVTEQRFDRTMTAALEPGEYRVLLWHRACEASCAQADLGSPDHVCGAQFRVTSGARVRAAVAFDPEDGCSVTVSPRSALLAPPPAGQG